MAWKALLMQGAAPHSSVNLSKSRKAEDNHISMFNFLGIKFESSKLQVAALSLGSSLLLQDPARALDMENAAKTWNCLLGGCRSELAQCIGDPSCAANLICLETCAAGDINCQVRCGDIFQNKVVEDFNTCLLTKKRCIAKKSDDGQFPVPPDCALVDSFNTADFTGTWYITSGFNPVFDIYDCQVHHFSASSHKLVGNLSWRVSIPGGGFLTRHAVQTFLQSPEHPAVLLNHDNEYLNYKDDWFIVSSRFNKDPDDYVFVYYRGANDAWDGYGGAVVYTRTPRLPSSIIPELQQAAASVGLDFHKFISTDNSCKSPPSLIASFNLFQGGEKASDTE